MPLSSLRSSIRPFHTELDLNALKYLYTSSPGYNGNVSQTACMQHQAEICIHTNNIQQRHHADSNASGQISSKKIADVCDPGFPQRKSR